MILRWKTICSINANKCLVYARNSIVDFFLPTKFRSQIPFATHSYSYTYRVICTHTQWVRAMPKHKLLYCRKIVLSNFCCGFFIFSNEIPYTHSLSLSPSLEFSIDPVSKHAKNTITVCCSVRPIAQQQLTFDFLEHMNQKKKLRQWRALTTCSLGS